MHVIIHSIKKIAIFFENANPSSNLLQNLKFSPKNLESSHHTTLHLCMKLFSPIFHPLTYYNTQYSSCPSRRVSNQVFDPPLMGPTPTQSEGPSSDSISSQVFPLIPWKWYLQKWLIVKMIFIFEEIQNVLDVLIWNLTSRKTHVSAFLS